MANIKDKEEDPFTRRKCMPRLVTFVSCEKERVNNATKRMVNIKRGSIMPQ